MGHQPPSLFRSVSSNWAVTIVTIGVMYVLTPFVIRTLGVEVYGTWTLIVSRSPLASLSTMRPAALERPLGSMRGFTPTDW